MIKDQKTGQKTETREHKNGSARTETYNAIQKRDMNRNRQKYLIKKEKYAVQNSMEVQREELQED